MATKLCTTQGGLPFEIYATADHLFDLVYNQEENSFLSETLALNITPADLANPKNLTDKKLIALIGLQMALAQNYNINEGTGKRLVAPNDKIETLLEALDASNFVLYLQDHEERPPIDCLYDLEGESSVKIPDNLQYNVLIGTNVVLGNLPDGGLALGFIGMPADEGTPPSSDSEGVDEEDVTEVIPAEILEDPTVSIQMLNFKIPDNLPRAKAFVDLDAQSMYGAILDTVKSVADNKDVSLPSALLTLRDFETQQAQQAQAIQEKFYPSYTPESISIAARRKVVELLGEINPSVFSGPSFIEYLLEENITPINTFLAEAGASVPTLIETLRTTDDIDTMNLLASIVSKYNFALDSLNEILHTLLSFYGLTPAQYEKFKINPESNLSINPTIDFGALVAGLPHKDALLFVYDESLGLLQQSMLRSNPVPLALVARYVLYSVAGLAVAVVAISTLKALVYEFLADLKKLEVARLEAECGTLEGAEKANCEKELAAAQNESAVLSELAKGGPTSIQYVLRELGQVASQLGGILKWILIGGVGIYGATKLYPHVRGMFKE